MISTTLLNIILQEATNPLYKVNSSPWAPKPTNFLGPYGNKAWSFGRADCKETNGGNAIAIFWKSQLILYISSKSHIFTWHGTLYVIHSFYQWHTIEARKTILSWAKTYPTIYFFFCTSYLFILSWTIVYYNRLTYRVLTRLWPIKGYKITFILW